MTDATVLADALVEAGILRLGKNNLWYVGPHDEPLPPLYRNVEASYEKLITDWRVAGKVLESMKAEWDVMSQARKIHCKWSLWHLNVLNPRAIIEAWYEATEQGESDE